MVEGDVLGAPGDLCALSELQPQSFSQIEFTGKAQLHLESSTD